ncbi:transferrin-binding protein-like solute binding protein [Acinetobacter larvae]|uniref:Uncharacterized protein n=1 Tax=Acinetobacter larvae TaxID=1789224 RepID=A0A1B2LYN2_9GAMM|nr:transferrin-binding protein-like solute binding protein [Acinetobacter larvae]AOA58050.1 hypothetical protein BFG52_06585 [Acinetobacter larvae]
MQLIKLLLATVVTSAAIHAQAANTVGATSNSSRIKVGAVGNIIKHPNDQPGVPGIAVINETNTAREVNNTLIDLNNLRDTVESNYVKAVVNLGGLDQSGIVQLDFNKWNIPKPVPDHSILGKFTYKQIQLDPNDRAQSVFFGEWHQPTATSASDNTRTTFFIGSSDNLSLPTSGTAKYQVIGINQYNGTVTGILSGWVGSGTEAAPNNLLHGVLTADFNNRTLKTLSDADTLKRVVSTAGTANTVKINAAIYNNGSFAGSAIANGTVNGEARGNFFGANAAAVAGHAVFHGNSQLNTAFGGSKIQ